MKCEDIQNQLSAYLDGMLELKTQHDVLAHLEGCVECEEYFNEVTAAETLLNKIVELPIPETDPEKAVLRWRGEIAKEPQSQMFSSLLSWRYVLVPLMAALVFLVFFYRPQNYDFQYYELDEKQVNLLEAEFAKNNPGESLYQVKDQIIAASVMDSREIVLTESYYASLAYEKNKEGTLTEEDDLNYYPISEKQARLLENESSSDNFKSRLKEFLSQMDNRPKDVLTGVGRKVLSSQNLLMRLAAEKQQVISKNDIETYKFYTQVEIVILSMLNEEQSSSRLAAVVSKKYL